jgi:hypothetical protein
MSRRSRSQRPRKAPSSEAPPRETPPATKAADPGHEPARVPVIAGPVDELAALDAGWDDLST